MSEGPQYKLFYHVPLAGRGEYVRLALEAAGVSYDDVAKVPGGKESQKAVMTALTSSEVPHFAVPMLEVVDGDTKLSMSQTPVCCGYIARRHGLEPDTEQQKLAAQALILTLQDVGVEAHNVHHPITPAKYYEEQKDAALLAAQTFTSRRIPQFVGFFARTVNYWQKCCGGGPFLFGSRLTLADLYLFHTMRGLQYAFPKACVRAMEKEECAALTALLSAVEEHPRIEAFLASPRHMAFSNSDIFRHYPELDL